MRQGLIIGIIGLAVLVCMGPAPRSIAEDASPEGLAIESVDVAGNVTLTRAQVLAAIRTRPGQTFNTQTVAEDVLRIARLDAAESAYYNTQIVDGPVALTYVVVEYNLVRTFRYEGNETLSDAGLTKELGFKKGDYLDVVAARAAIDSLR